MQEEGEVKRIAVCGLGMLLLSSACTRTASIPVPPVTKPSSAFAAWSQSGHAEKRVCVLPFTNRTTSEGVADRVRESFFGRLVLKRFTDANLRDIDARLSTLPESWEKMSPHQLGQALNCDALVYGEVMEASNLYLGVYAQLTLEGKIQFVNTTSNETLVVGSYASKFRTGGVPFSLLEAVPSAILNLRNFMPEQSLRAVDELARNLADKIPDLPPNASETATFPQQRVPRKSESPNTSPPLNPPPLLDRYRVQVAAFSSQDEARHVAQRLRDQGFQPKIISAATENRLWHKVLLGPFPSWNIAQETRAQVQQRLSISPMIVRMH